MPSLDFEAEKKAFRNYYESQRELLDEARLSFVGLVSALLRDASSAASSAEISKIESRLKDKEECIEKFSRKYRKALEESRTPYEIAPHITDLIGLRVVCLYEDHIAAIGDTLGEHFEVVGMSDKTATIENTEGNFGYKGLHLDVRLSEARAAMHEYRPYAGFAFEIQVRTIVQDSWSTLDHKIKYKKSIPNRLKRRINTLAALFELADREFREIRVATDEEIKRAQEEPEAQEDDPAASTTPVATRQDPPAAPAAARAASRPSKPQVLDAFAFLRIANHFFPGSTFEARKVDGFVQEVLTADPAMSRASFNKHLRSTIGHVKRYQIAFQEASTSVLSPLTLIRHCLYLSDRQRFMALLNAMPRENFELWLQDNPPG